MRLTAFVVLCFLATSINAGDWPSWRGAFGNGTAEGTGYPLQWSSTSGIVWRIPIPGRGASSPIVAGDRIFLTSTVPGEPRGNNVVMCIGMDGRIQWERNLGTAVEGKASKDGTGANPSVVSDGTYIFAYFKSGDFGCFTVSGEPQWHLNLQDMYGEDTLWWDLGTSPVLTKDAVVIACMHSGPSYVAAFEKATGKLKWKHDRNLGAPEEAAQSYATPVVVTDGGREQIVVLGADNVTTHDAETGREIWRLSGLNPTNHQYFRSIASAVVADGIVIAPYARGESLTAVRMGGEGDITSTHVLWANIGPGTAADVPTPAISNGRVYICRDSGEDRGTIDCLDLQTGKVVWSGQLPKNRNTFRASPIVADGRVYVTRQDGTIFVVDATGHEFRLLAENSVGNAHTVATPSFVNGRILLRSEGWLTLIGGN